MELDVYAGWRLKLAVPSWSSFANSTLRKPTPCVCISAAIIIRDRLGHKHCFYTLVVIQ